MKKNSHNWFIMMYFIVVSIISLPYQIDALVVNEDNNISGVVINSFDSECSCSIINSNLTGNFDAETQVNQVTYIDGHQSINGMESVTYQHDAETTGLHIDDWFFDFEAGATYIGESVFKAGIVPIQFGLSTNRLDDLYFQRGNFNNVTATNICYSNGTNCQASSTMNYTNIAMMNITNVGNFNVSGNITFGRYLKSTAPDGDIILMGGSNIIFRGLRFTGTDSIPATWFQVGNPSDNMTFSSAGGNYFNKATFRATKFSILDTDTQTGDGFEYRKGGGRFHINASYIDTGSLWITKVDTRATGSGFYLSSAVQQATAGQYSGLQLCDYFTGTDCWYGSDIRSQATANAGNFKNPVLTFNVQNYNTYTTANRINAVNMSYSGTVVARNLTVEDKYKVGTGTVKVGKTTSVIVVTSVDFLGSVYTSCSLNITGGIVQTDSSC